MCFFVVSSLSRNSVMRLLLTIIHLFMNQIALTELTDEHLMDEKSRANGKYLNFVLYC